MNPSVSGDEPLAFDFDAGAELRSPLQPWPDPPEGPRAPRGARTASIECQAVLTSGETVIGRLTRFDPELGVAQLLVAERNKSLALEFGQLRCLAIAAPLLAMDRAGAPPAAGRYRVQWRDGAQMGGDTIGHAEAPAGFFFFMPVQDGTALKRLFFPREGIDRLELWHRPDAPARLLVVPAARRGAAAPPAGAAAAPPARETIQVVSTFEQLVESLEAQARMPLMRIGEALVSLGMVSDAQLSQALEHQQRDRSVPLGEVLVRMHVVSREDLQTALVRKMGYPVVDLARIAPEAEALRKLGYVVAQRLQAMPLMVHEGRLVVALDDPVGRHAALDEIEFVAQMKVRPVLGQASNIGTLLHAAYERIGAAHHSAPAPLELSRPLEFDLGGTTELLETLEKETQQQQQQQPRKDDAPIEQSDNSLVRLINQMIVEAHRDGVSDIHIESYPGREKVRIRFRRDGRLYTYLELPVTYRNAVVARIKIMCDLDISEKRKPQDGKINFARYSPEHRLELRVATIPTQQGLEDVVMRLLSTVEPLPLDRLGLSAANLPRLAHAVERPYGLVLCVGPTGSGKTTTLHSALRHVNTPERKIWTAEDPVEITQPGLRQVQVNPRIDWTFERALRAFLRADPDVIMVGEIRDTQTARIAIEASLTGHMVMSTLHTNSAPETVTRLLDMGMDPFNFADALLAVLAQRLVRRLCSHCRRERPASEDEVEELLADYLNAFADPAQAPTREALRAEWTARHGQDGLLMHHDCPGCEQCDGSGFRGRVGIHELMSMSRELRRLVQSGARAEALQACAMAQGMRTLRQDGIEKVLAGHTTIDEVRATSSS